MMDRSNPFSSQDYESASSRPVPRPWIGVYFTCCRVYARIYLNREGNAFTGHCPRCARPARIEVRADGVASRFWVAE
ncbi:MAG TPA: hypothetical protein PK349_13565 [Candidatus Hydrogenedentes bacterium]|nr:hypothetical protein [Candidatus Hydrogenedentota bacterium]HOV62080.1 hypothetical protein [Candidatus Hydrogenedentota bacterium]